MKNKGNSDFVNLRHCLIEMFYPAHIALFWVYKRYDAQVDSLHTDEIYSSNSGHYFTFYLNDIKIHA